jgi:formylglycine-generating enzyme required for sulfatase activity
VAGIASGVSRFLARLNPRPAWKNRRWLVATGGLALILTLTIGFVWVTQQQVPIPSKPDPGPSAGTDKTPGKAAPDEPRHEDQKVPPATVEGEVDSNPPPDDGQPPKPEAAEPPVSSFRDCEECPEMVVIPAGRFTMGAPSTDPDAEPQEKRQRDVAIKKEFALGRYAVTEREWQACVEDRVCRTDRRARAADFPDHPKTHVNWWDARRFVRWLNQKTEQNYRLPTEEEWEYAARAGTHTRYPWGDEIGQNKANCRDCGAAMSGQGTAPADSFAANAFGLFNMVGNVWEWTATCSKSASGTCTQRIVRGGSWDNSASAVRVSQRETLGVDVRADNVGVRVVRDMP